MLGSSNLAKFGVLGAGIGATGYMGARSVGDARQGNYGRAAAWGGAGAMGGFGMLSLIRGMRG